MLRRVLLEDSRRTGLGNRLLLLLGKQELLLVELIQTLSLCELHALLLLLLSNSSTLRSERLEPGSDKAGVTLLLLTRHLLLHQLSLEELKLELLGSKELLLLLEDLGMLAELREVDALARLHAGVGKGEVRKTTGESGVVVILVEAIRD